MKPITYVARFKNGSVAIYHDIIRLVSRLLRDSFVLVDKYEHFIILPKDFLISLGYMHNGKEFVTYVKS